MSDLVRLYRYKGLLSTRRAVSARDLMSELEISRPTLKRDLAKLRDQLRVPVVYDRDRGGYVLEADSEQTELPGLWFGPDELLALATLQHLIQQLTPGLLATKLQPLTARLNDLIARQGLSPEAITGHIRLTHSAGKRKLDPGTFEAVATATIARKRIRITHFNRQTNATSEREISPHRLVHYRDNWYLDAWCHLRASLRCFSVDALKVLKVQTDAAQEVDAGELDRVLGASYGMFAGEPMATAVLRFSADRARWVRRENWHPLQTSRELRGGGLELSVPYSDERELIGDVLRHSPGVEVVAPAALRQHVRNAAVQAARLNRPVRIERRGGLGR